MIRNRFSRIIAIMMILFAVGLAALWELYFDDKVNTIAVLQATSLLPKGHRITQSDFTLLRIKINTLPEQAVTDLNDILNKEAIIPINKGVIAVKGFFDDSEILPAKNQMITPIPNQWIFSLPGSLRRKDKVSIYDFTAQSSEYQDSTNVSGQPKSPPLISDNNLPGNNSTPGFLFKEPILKDIVVAFAKDAANQEVKPSNDKSQRIDATGNISQLELVMTPEQFAALKNKASNGFKFIFTYR